MGKGFFLVDGEVGKPQLDDCDGLWSDSPKASGLDMHHRLPDLLAGLAESLSGYADP